MKIKIGRVEMAFAVSLVAYIAAAWVNAPGKDLVKLVAAALFVWSCVRLARGVPGQLLWRLRNRLIVAYFFIAFVPVILITALAALAIALVGGQISIYLVTSELDRRTAALKTNIEFLARRADARGEWRQTTAPLLANRFPGIQIVLKDNQVWTYPQDAAMPGAPGGWADASGLVLKDEKLYGWAHVAIGQTQVTAMFPITREYLGSILPDIGESAILRVREQRQSLLHPTPTNWTEPSRNRLPPAANILDREIWGVTPLTVAVWDRPSGPQEDVWLSTRTRPSAILRTVLTQKVDFANEIIPILFFGVAILFLIAELIAFVIGVSLTRTITAAVHELHRGTRKVMRGDFSHQIPIHGNDQLAELGVSFNQMTANVQRLLSIEKERERLQAELEIAREVQNQLYPKHVPQIPSLQMTAVCQPARMVSGDYYDYQQIGRDKVAIAIGDVAGKGISAALLMATVQSSFRTQLRSSIEIAAPSGRHSPGVKVSTSTVVSCLNEQLYADTSPEKYATFYLGIYDEGTSELTYTNAGHLPPILVREGHASRLEVNGMVVGAFPKVAYGENRIRLEPGDLLVFFTDGVSEPENEYGEMFGEDRLTELVVKSACQEDTRIIELITEAVRQWTGSDELQDDMTLLLVRRS